MMTFWVRFWRKAPRHRSLLASVLGAETHFARLLFAWVVVVCLIGCTKVDTRNSILVIAVDRLGVDALSCASDGPGFSTLCDESLRFTHAFTTSTLSAPAMSSILTGLYPIETGLRHNGNGAMGSMAARVETVAERAVKTKMRTAFIASSAPFLRRTGLHQGFEVFDDGFSRDTTTIHRSARETVDLFLKWQQSNQVAHSPFFAVLQLGDLQLPWAPGLDESGRLRESTVKGQVDEVDSALGRLWDQLKARKLWNTTSIVLVGLQGELNESRRNEVPALDLHSEMTHVAMLIKEGSGETAVSKGREKSKYNWTPKSWTFDANVSLADLGLTLGKWIDGAEPKTDIDGVRSFDKILSGPNLDSESWRKTDRLIITESAWARWRYGEAYPIRMSIREGPYLFIYDRTPLLYNTLMDAAESASLPSRSEKTRELQAAFTKSAESIGYRAFPGLPTLEVVKERWARTFFSRRLGARVPDVSDSDQKLVENALGELSSEGNFTGGDLQLHFWKNLFEWDRGIYKFPRTPCADAIFGSPAVAAAREAQDSTAELLRVSNVCGFRGSREIAKWYRAQSTDERERAFESILRLDRQRRLGVRVAETSIALGRIWETGVSRLENFEPMEVVLGQPEASRLRLALMRRTQNLPEP